MHPTQLLVLSFIFKLLSRKNLFNNIREKHGNETARLCRQLEKSSAKMSKVKLDIDFLLTCKKENLIPTFAKPKLSVPSESKLQAKIAKLIIQTELKNKHALKRSLKGSIKESTAEIQGKLGFLTYYAFKYRIGNAIHHKKKKWVETHKKKLQKLRANHDQNSSTGDKRKERQLPPVIHNFSAYNLSDNEIRVLSKTLDHYIPPLNDKKSKRTQVEFERFYSGILDNANNLDEETKLTLKTNFLKTYNKYTNIKISSNDQHIINNLYKNQNIVILRQDKGRGVVILNRTDYISKCEDFLNGPEFQQLKTDPTASFQTRVQTKLRKMKKKFNNQDYKRLYPSGSQPGLFFGLAKVHKLKDGQDTVDHLPLRPVISNIGTTTYQISKHLANLLTPLTKSEHNIESTSDFIDKLKRLKIDNGYKMVSLDVVSLFTSVPLNYTINVILDEVYKKKKIQTKLTRTQLKTLLELCTKEMHFSFNGKIYKQKKGVAMGSPLGPVIANIFMVHLEKQMIHRLSDKMSSWFRYVDDTFTFIKEGEAESIKEALNGFHADIKFTYEVETDGRIPFLDVNVTRKDDGTFDTEVYRKKTDSNIYINWEAFASRSWKIGTLQGLLRRAFLVCSTKEAQDKEIKFLKHIFTKVNGYPSRVVNDTLHKVRNKINIELQQ